jgi:hypothetical protein
MNERTPELDRRIALHEAGHIVVGRALGAEFGGATINAGPDFSGMAWGPSFEAPSRLSDLNLATDICERVRLLMPGPCDPRVDGAEFYTHAHFRIVELMAGTEAERIMHIADPPLEAINDLAQARAFANIVCCSNLPSAIEQFLNFARAEAAALIAAHHDIVLAIAAGLLEKRTLSAAELDQLIAASLARQDFEAEKRRRADMAQCVANARAFAAYTGGNVRHSTLCGLNSDLA